jgi:hypothetical protein
MSQKSSVTQIANLVPWVLTPDTVEAADQVSAARPQSSAGRAVFGGCREGAALAICWQRARISAFREIHLADG